MKKNGIRMFSPHDSLTESSSMLDFVGLEDWRDLNIVRLDIMKI